ncbi:MAG TPA: ABC transporter ATP-binding protein [Burkholderiaceae bacterium]|jgi:multiple sugar transport system ATP-binding protein|nr:ABC transporter ATP-binding protein [Burkholderiaceae bacterium]
MSDIQIRSLSKSFGATRVLNGVSLDVHDGEFISLVGPSGCGKSTLLRILAGLEAQDEGEVRMGGERIDSLAPGARDIAMVFQSYALYPHLSVRDNIAVPLLVRRLNRWQRMPLIGGWWPGGRAIRHQIEAEVQAAARLLDISRLLDRRPGQLSGGQRQRTALGRAMVRRPQAYLMDEPLSNLDANLRVQMRSEIAALHRSRGGTFVYVTHDQTEALTMSTRLAVMMDGVLLQVASPADIYFDPVDLRVAEFVGNPRINLLACDADAHGGILHRNAALGLRLAHRGGMDRRVTVGVRSEAIRLTPRTGEGRLGTVTGHEHLGSEVLVQVTLNDGGAVVVGRRDALGGVPERGAEVSVAFEAGRVLAFGSDGRRLALARAPHG